MAETMLAEAVTPVSPEDQIRRDVLKRNPNLGVVLKVDVKKIAAFSYRVNVWTQQDNKTDCGLLIGGKITHSEVVKFKEHIPNN